MPTSAKKKPASAAVTPTGYWIVAANGGVYNFGSAGNDGRMPASAGLDGVPPGIL